MGALCLSFLYLVLQGDPCEGPIWALEVRKGFEREAQGFRVRAVSHLGDSLGPGQEPWRDADQRLQVSPWKPLNFPDNTTKRGLTHTGSYSVLKRPFYCLNFGKNEVTLTRQPFVDMEVNDTEFVNV